MTGCHCQSRVISDQDLSMVRAARFGRAEHFDHRRRRHRASHRPDGDPRYEGGDQLPVTRCQICHRTVAYRPGCLVKS
jgi:hypothetical protein